LFRIVQNGDHAAATTHSTAEAYLVFLAVGREGQSLGT
jgi:hypothetical protein